MRVEFIEPLFEKVKELIRSGEKECLQKSLSLYGIEQDINALVQLINQKSDNRTLVVVDFTPFTALGTQTRLHRLAQAYEAKPFIALVKEGIVLEHLRTLGKISTIIIDDDYKVVESSFEGKRRVSLKNKCTSYFRKGTNAFSMHTRWVEEKLLKLVPNCIRKAEPGCRYIRLADDTWVDRWIDIKELLSDPNMALFIAYQIGYQISKGYSQIPPDEILVAGNNNAYILASFLHLIFSDKELVMLDRLGPYPSLSRTRLLEAQRVEKKRCCVIEDVLGTGREIDLTALLIFLTQGHIERVACLYDLQIASPLLVPEEKIVSLCRPSPNISYERLPKYKVPVDTRE